MSQKKVNLKRIANDKTRIITYKKRKASIYKKAEEFSTLCGIDTCLIVYGPTKATDEVVSEPEIWPRDETKVRDIIRKYRDTVSNTCKKANHVETFVNDLGGDTKERDTNKRVKSDNNKYCSWDEKLDKCSQEQLLGIFCAVENKLHEAMARQYRSMLRVHHQATEIPVTHSVMGQQYNMQQYFPVQHFHGSMFPNNNNNMGFSFTSSHDDQIQMDANHVENWTELGLTQGLMMSKGNDVPPLMQGQAPCYNLEPVLQRQASLNANPFAGYVGPFNTPWRLPSNQTDDWFLSEKKQS